MARSIKPAACDPVPTATKVRALVFDSYREMKAAIDDENLDVERRTMCWLLRNAGPQGGPGMPELGKLPMPKALLKDRGNTATCWRISMRDVGARLRRLYLHVRAGIFRRWATWRC